MDHMFIDVFVWVLIIIKWGRDPPFLHIFFDGARSEFLNELWFGYNMLQLFVITHVVTMLLLFASCC